MNETELIFSEILHCDRVSLYQNHKTLLSKETGGFLARALARRLSGEPVQYILGKACFMGFDFKVNPQVLIPRPETEILVEIALRYAAQIKKGSADINILDIGTGSGCIAVALAKLLDNARVSALDISEEALNVAADNARLNLAEDKVEFFKSDLFSGIRGKGKYDLIVSNPPYVSGKEFKKLELEVKCEPRLALDGGMDGLEFYRRIIKDAPEYLKPRGFLILEIGFGQSGALKKILKLSEKLILAGSFKDYNRIDRVIVAKRKN